LSALPAGASRLGGVFTVTTAIFLAVAPFAGGAGVRTAALLASALACAALVARDPQFGAGAMPRAVAACFAAWALLAVVSAGWSVDSRFTRGELQVEVAYGTLALAAFCLGASPARWRIWGAALLAGALLVALTHGIQEAFDIRLTRHDVAGQGGLWSTYLVLVAPFVLALGWAPPWGGARGPVPVGAGLLLLFAVAWETGNRMVWPALCIQLVLAVLLLRSPAPAESRGLRAPRVMAALAVLLVAGAFAAAVSDRNAANDARASVPDGLAHDVRPRIWALAWERFRDAPWIGHGFGREILAEEFRPATPDIPGHPPVEHAHNLFIDMALELGALGLAAFLALLGALATEYRACLRDPRVAPLGVLGLALLAGFVVKNLTDDFLHRHVGLVFWALNGTLLGLARRASPAPEAGA